MGGNNGVTPGVLHTGITPCAVVDHRARARCSALPHSPELPAHRHLPRLPAAAYQGHVFVHWTFTVDRRTTGWLDEHAHLQWREILLHMCARYSVSLPVYCLMPDHVHLVTAGLCSRAEHRLAIRFLRQHSTAMLRGRTWQRQTYDHVLRSSEREPDAFERVAWYILHNPVRAGLVGQAAEYPFSGCALAGYPSLTPFAPDYWEKYWRLTGRLSNGRGLHVARANGGR
jgi:putative transposase